VENPQNILSTTADDQSDKKLYTKVTYHMNVIGKKKSFESTCGVKQGDNLGQIIFIFMIQAVSMTLDKKWDFETLDFCWHGMKIDGIHKWNSNLGTGMPKKGHHSPSGSPTTSVMPHFYS
jgi:hypothetical protein